MLRSERAHTDTAQREVQVKAQEADTLRREADRSRQDALARGEELRRVQELCQR